MDLYITGESYAGRPHGRADAEGWMAEKLKTGIDSERNSADSQEGPILYVQSTRRFLSVSLNIISFSLPFLLFLFLFLLFSHSPISRPCSVSILLSSFSRRPLHSRIWRIHPRQEQQRRDHSVQGCFHWRRLDGPCRPDDSHTGSHVQPGPGGCQPGQGPAGVLRPHRGRHQQGQLHGTVDSWTQKGDVIVERKRGRSVSRMTTPRASRRENEEKPCE